MSVAREPDPTLCYSCYVEGRSRIRETSFLLVLAAEELDILEIESGCSHGPTTTLSVVPSEHAGAGIFSIVNAGITARCV